MNVCYSLRAKVGIKVIFLGRVGERSGSENADHLILETGKWKVVSSVFLVPSVPDHPTKQAPSNWADSGKTRSSQRCPRQVEGHLQKRHHPKQGLSPACHTTTGWCQSASRPGGFGSSSLRLDMSVKQNQTLL